MTEMSTTIGLANLGNTCFLNVVLQALRLSPPLCDMFLIHNVEARKESNKKQLLDAFQIIIRDFWRHSLPPGAKPMLNPRGFHGAFLRTIQESGDDWHRYGQQSDAAETIQYILNGIHDAMYKKVIMQVVGSVKNPEEQAYIKAIESWNAFFSKEYSPIIENYNGQTQTEVICDRCKVVSTRYEPWLMLKVPLPGGDMPNRTKLDATLTDCLNLAFADESLDDYQCDACKTKGKATIRNRISRMPDTIILTFKRFTNSMQKVAGKVAWDIDGFDFRPWMAFKGDPFNRMYTPPVYETTALIEQQGSFRGGHYRMYAKQEQQWYEYDDNAIQNVPGETASNCDTYIAFLSRKTNLELANVEMRCNIHILRLNQNKQKNLSAAEA
jgi:ubiquitin C-terminal hydrolase